MWTKQCFVLNRGSVEASTIFKATVIDKGRFSSNLGETFRISKKCVKMLKKNKYEKKE